MRGRGVATVIALLLSLQATVAQETPTAPPAAEAVTPAPPDPPPMPPEKPAPPPVVAEAPKDLLDPCGTIEQASRLHGLRADFFTRLLWQESNFRPDAVSPKGAQGIAQFMPGTASDRGLDDPFEPVQAIFASAALLADLRARFGNLGLAAAAYNGGPTRVANWLAGTGTLPYETQAYVRIITGYSAEEWMVEDRTLLDEKLLGPAPERPTCPEIKLELARRSPAASGLAAIRASNPWGVQLAGSFSQTAALNLFANIKLRYGKVLAALDPIVISKRQRSRGRKVYHRVRIGAPSRANADKLCNSLHALGAACVVLRN